MKSDTLDRVDLRIIHVLAIDGRASFRTLGEVGGCSDQTAARRYRRLQELADLRVLGGVDAARVGWEDWMLRLHCTPAGTGPVADALARRPDTHWVQLASGGTEIVCVVQARTADQRDALLLRGLPGSRHVVGITAHLLLETYSPAAWRGITSALTAAEAARVNPPEVRPGAGRIQLDRLDEALLARLAEDGRAAHTALAAELHTDASTVRRRIEELRRSGVLRFEVDLDSSHLGINTHAFLWLAVEPTALGDVGTALSGHDEVAFAAATTGPTNLFASLVCRDTNHLFHYLNTRLRDLPAIRSVETAPLIRTLKRTGRLPQSAA